jgi:thioredoxin reductase/NAD-dependent dihydropyrimidine dehydrogenase PreA subunit/thiosulfate reductase cytochrome b subunit
MNIEGLIFSVSFAFVAVLIAVVRQWRTRRLEQRSADRVEQLREAGIIVPPTLHPVIDPNRCISSTTCTRICPQGNDVIGLIGGRGTLVDPSMCIGHGRCAAECPMDAIRLVFGTSERGVDIPHLKSTFETNVPGLYITGELGGMGLIANAIRQAKSGMLNLKESLSNNPPMTSEGIADVVIIGAGPAGLTSALAAQEYKLNYRWLEQESIFGGSLLHFPRGKIVMTATVDMPLLGRVHSKTMKKEEMVLLWENAICNHGLKLESGVTVTAISKNGDIFDVQTNLGTVQGRKVMLCIGRRGSPRKLGVPGEETDKVFYSLREPEVFAGERVLIVGGGDSAIEAACQLAEQTDAKVTLSYRSAAISRAKPENRARFNQLVQSGLIKAIYNSEVTAIQPDNVTLTMNGQTYSLPNDKVLIFAGGLLPINFLQKAGIHFERHFGEETERHQQLDEHEIFEEIKKQRRKAGGIERDRRHDRTGWWIALFATMLIAAIFFAGSHYYLSLLIGNGKIDTKSIFHSSGFIGHGIGILAMVFMLMNLTYFLRKEFKVMQHMGPIQSWMTLHMGSGLLAGALVVLHSTLVTNNLFAVFLYTSLAIVIITGVIGRYIFSFIPLDPRGRPLTRASLKAIHDRMENDYDKEFKGLSSLKELKRVLQDEESNEPAPSLLGSALGLVSRWPKNYMKLILLSRSAKKEIKDPEEVERFITYGRELLGLAFEMEYLPHLKKILGGWRAGHGILAILMIFLVIAHVVIEFWVGYRWIF